MIEWNPVAQDRQARKAAQEAEEARREAELFVGECPKCKAYFDGGALPDESKAQIREGTHPGIFCPACQEKGYVVVGVIRMEVEHG